MRKVKELEQEAKPDGYVLTDKGLQAARRQGKWPSSLRDIILQRMVRSPDAPLTKGALSEDFWQEASNILAHLEADGLVRQADSNIQPGKPKAVPGKSNAMLGNPVKLSGLKLKGESKPKAFGLTKVVYSDKKGERLARKKHRGWKRVRYQ